MRVGTTTVADGDHITGKGRRLSGAALTLLVFLVAGPLVGGAAVFGIGWGIAGFCPGGAIPALGLGYSATPIFVAAVIAGIIVARFARVRLAQPAAT